MKSILIILLMFISLLSTAQEKEEHIPTIIKLPLSMLIGEIYSNSAGFGIEVERQLSRKNSISLGFGYLLNTPKSSFLGEHVDQLNGFRISSELRRYLSNKPVTQSGFFISIDSDHILTHSTGKAWVDNLKVTEKINRYRTTTHFNIGVNSFTTPFNKGNRISLEFIAGIGLGYVNAHSNVEKQVFTKEITKNINYNNGVGFYPAINFDIKLGFTL